MLSVAPLIIHIDGPKSVMHSPSGNHRRLFAQKHAHYTASLRSVPMRMRFFLALPRLLGQYEWIEPGAVIRPLEIARRKSSLVFRVFHSLLRPSSFVLDEERTLLF